MNQEQYRTMPNRESEHDLVYGQAFAEFRREEIEATISNYANRFAANGIDPRKVFGGKTCLDAGCGYGRGSLFMLSNGAARVEAVDISLTNAETARQQLSAFGFENFRTRVASIERLPFEDESYDVVWCYGVIQRRPSWCV